MRRWEGRDEGRNNERIRRKRRWERWERGGRKNERLRGKEDGKGGRGGKKEWKVKEEEKVWKVGNGEERMEG